MFPFLGKLFKIPTQPKPTKPVVIGGYVPIIYSIKKSKEDIMKRLDLIEYNIMELKMMVMKAEEEKKDVVVVPLPVGIGSSTNTDK